MACKVFNNRRVVSQVCLIMFLLFGFPIGITGNYWFLLGATPFLLVGAWAFASRKYLGTHPAGKSGLHIFTRRVVWC